MNIVESFANWLEDESVATLGQDLFISRAQESPNEMYWLIGSGGATGTKNVNTGYISSYDIAVYYRGRDPQDVYDRLHTLRDQILDEECFDLDDFVVISASTSGPFTDQDLDNEDRTVGLLQVTITTYRE